MTTTTKALIIRPKNITDNAIRSGNAVAATVLLDLAILEGPSDGAWKGRVYHRYAVERLLLLGGAMARPEQVDELSERIPLLAGRTQIDGAPTAYVCENYACQLQVNEPEALLRMLE